MNLLIRFVATCNYLASGVWYKIKEVDFDYSEYLGKDYKKTQIVPKHAPSAYVWSGHTSWIDNLITMAAYGSTFLGKESLAKVPFVGYILTVHGMMYVNRAGSAEEKDRVVTELVERLKLTEDEGKYSPIGVFPEGTTFNNGYILPFKRGVFVGDTSIKPGYLHYDCPYIHAH